MYLAISETITYRATKLGDVIATSNSDHKNMLNNLVNVVLVIHNKQPHHKIGTYIIVRPHEIYAYIRPMAPSCSVERSRTL